MLQLVCLLRRRPGMSTAEFHDYWRDHHGPLVAGTKSGGHVRRYEQHHRSAADYERAGGPEFDGVAVQWFDSVEEFHASLTEADYAEIAADLPRFLDVANLVWMLTDEPEVII